MVHLPALPGAPRHEGGLGAVRERAWRDALALERAGVDGVILENFGDAPFYPDTVPPETVAALSVIAAGLREKLGVPLGVNVLRNDAHAALAVAGAAELSFVRINVHAGIRVTDQGLVAGRAHHTLRLRQQLGLKQVAILADVQVKHSAPLARRSLAQEAEELAERALADAILVTGEATGDAPDPAQVEEARRAVRVPILVASGVTPDSAARLLEHADGCIVGSAFKFEGDPLREVDPHRAKEVVAAIKSSWSRGGSR